MRADIVTGSVFPDYELTDHGGKRRRRAQPLRAAPAFPHRHQGFLHPATGRTIATRNGIYGVLNTSRAPTTNSHRS
jgi:hypothetical protein